MNMESFLAWWAAGIGKLISPQLSVFLVSILPIIEERGGLILSRMLNLPLNEALIWCILGNILPIPFVLLGLQKLLHFLDDHHMSKIAEWLVAKAEKNKPKIDKYGFWGLALFVGIPLPGTGAWTGALVASVFDMDRKKASVSIVIGVLLAALIMSIVSYGLLGSLLG